MTDERWKQLSESDDFKLTPAEIALGWHWCNEFDGLLVGPGMDALHSCTCWPKEHPLYKTAPWMPDITINEGDL